MRWKAKVPAFQEQTGGGWEYKAPETAPMVPSATPRGYVRGKEDRAPHHLLQLVRRHRGGGASKSGQNRPEDGRAGRSRHRAQHVRVQQGRSMRRAGKAALPSLGAAREARGPPAIRRGPGYTPQAGKSHGRV